LLTMKCVAELIPNTPSITYCFVYISVGMTIYPIVDTTACYIVAKLHRKGSVDRTSFELISHKLIRRHMMGGYNNMLSFACGNTALYEFLTCFMFLIETLGGKSKLPVTDSVEICYTSFRLIFFVRRYFCPKCRGNQVNLTVERDDTIINYLDISCQPSCRSLMSKRL